MCIVQNPKELEYDEIEAWLGSTVRSLALVLLFVWVTKLARLVVSMFCFSVLDLRVWFFLSQTTGNEESVTSSEFERFLAERAAAAESLPSTDRTGSTNSGAPAAKSKDNKDGLFAL